MGPIGHRAPSLSGARHGSSISAARRLVHCAPAARRFNVIAQTYWRVGRNKLPKIRRSRAPIRSAPEVGNFSSFHPVGKTVVTIDIARINRGRGYRLSLGVETRDNAPSYPMAAGRNKTARDRLKHRSASPPNSTGRQQRQQSGRKQPLALKQVADRELNARDPLHGGENEGACGFSRRGGDKAEFGRLLYGHRGAAWSLRQYEINLDTRPPMPHGPPPSDSRFRAADPALPPAPAPPVPGSLRRRAEVSGTLRQSAFVHCNSDRRAQGSSRSVFALVSERACDLLKALLPVQ